MFSGKDMHQTWHTLAVLFHVAWFHLFNEDLFQTLEMLSVISVFAGQKYHLNSFVMVCLELSLFRIGSVAFSF